MSVLANVLAHVKGDDNKVCDLEANDDYLTQVKPKYAVQFLNPLHHDVKNFRENQL